MKDQLARNNGLVYNNHHRHLNKMLLVLAMIFLKSCSFGVKHSLALSFTHLLQG
jgi:hypothetical protein